MTNKYIYRYRIYKPEFREIIKRFSLDVGATATTETTITELVYMNRPTIVQVVRNYPVIIY